MTMSASERAKIERLRRLLDDRRLVFVEVGSHAWKDRAIATTIETYDGDEYAGTTNNPAYTRLLRDIVRRLED